MGRRSTAALALAAFAAAVAPAADGAAPLRPPITQLAGEHNYWEGRRGPGDVDRIVVHVTEGSFWGAVQWLRNPRAHASSHFVVSRDGHIVQLVHVQDVAWHAGNKRFNVRSVGIEHEGATYDPAGFTDTQYHASARLAAYLAERLLLPIDREHIIGHAQVPDPYAPGSWGGASNHTDPGPHWRWGHYLSLVRRYASGVGKLRLRSLGIRKGRVLRSLRPWSAAASPGTRRVEFVVNDRVAFTDRKAPFTFRRGRGLNTTKLRNGSHRFELHAYGTHGRHVVQRFSATVANRPFEVTSSLGPWRKVRGVVRVRARARGSRAVRVTLWVDGRRVASDARAPFVFGLDTRRRTDGRHRVELVAESLDGRVARLRTPVVVANVRPKPKPTPKPAPRPPAKPAFAVGATSLAEGGTVTGFLIVRAEVIGRAARVEFWIDGVLRGTDRGRPFTLGWDTAAETPGRHRVVARAFAPDGRVAERAVTVVVAPPA